VPKPKKIKPTRYTYMHFIYKRHIDNYNKVPSKVSLDHTTNVEGAYTWDIRLQKNIKSEGVWQGLWLPMMTETDEASFCEAMDLDTFMIEGQEWHEPTFIGKAFKHTFSHYHLMVLPVFWNADAVYLDDSTKNTETFDAENFDVDSFLPGKWCELDALQHKYGVPVPVEKGQKILSQEVINRVKVPHGCQKKLAID